MSSGKRIVSVLIVMALWLSSLPFFSFAASPEGTEENEAAGIISPVGLSGTEGVYVPEASEQDGGESIIPVGYSGNYDGFELHANKTFISLGESFEVKASFGKEIESNTATLTLTYDPDLFEYQGFKPAGNVNVVWPVSENIGDINGEVDITLMIMGYDLLNIGTFSFIAKADEELYGAESLMSASVEYVLRDDGGKSTLNDFSEAEMLLAILGDTNFDKAVDILDLSELIDYFGLDDSTDDWTSARWFDFNRNGSIDISDIVVIAQIIVDKD